MSDTKRQGRVTKEAPQQLGMASHAATLVADRRLDIFRGIGGEVRQAAVLQVAPEELHRGPARTAEPRRCGSADELWSAHDPSSNVSRI